MVLEKDISSSLQLKGYCSAIERCFGSGTRNHHIFSTGPIELDDEKRLSKKYLKKIKTESKSKLKKLPKGSPEYQKMEALRKYLSKHA
jgi:hypothetical protein